MDRIPPAAGATDPAAMSRVRGLWVAERAGIVSPIGFDPAALMRDLDALVARQAAREAAQPPPVMTADIECLSNVRKAALALAHALADLRRRNGIARPAHYLLAPEFTNLAAIEEQTAALAAAADRAVQAGEERLDDRGAESVADRTSALGELVAIDTPAVFQKHFALPCEWTADDGGSPLVRFIVAALIALNFDLITPATVVKIQERCRGMAK